MQGARNIVSDGKRHRRLPKRTRKPLPRLRERGADPHDRVAQVRISTHIEQLLRVGQLSSIREVHLARDPVATFAHSRVCLGQDRERQLPETRRDIASTSMGVGGLKVFGSVRPREGITFAVHPMIGQAWGMKITVLGGCGAWPAAGRACSGYLVEHDSFRLLVDPGYATLPRLLQVTTAEQVDAVIISHGHPDHCADLHPLLRARTLRDDPAPPLPVHTVPEGVTKVLALDRPGMLDDAYRVHEFAPGDRLSIGPFDIATWLLPHFVPNAGMRLTAGGRTLAYTGDTGPSPDVVDLARDVDLFLAEATFADEVPADSARFLSSARQAGENAARANVEQLLLTHLMPGSDPSTAHAAARRVYGGKVTVVQPGTTIDLDDG
jgi:ribonuclease BN (tRNA processing enzyme)